MSLRSTLFGVLLAGIGLISTPVTASVVIYDSAPGTLTTGYFSDDSYGQYIATPFDLAEETSFDAMSFQGVYAFGPQPTDPNFQIAIYRDNNGSPRRNAAYTRSFDAVASGTGQDLFGYEITDFRADFSSLTLEAGSWWIALIELVAPSSGGGTPGNFAWLGDNTSGPDFAYRFSPSSRWFDAGAFLPSFSFESSELPPALPSLASIPLPAAGSLLLTGLGLGIVISFRGRRRRRY